MSLYTIGDLHLSLGGDKPMDVFGGRWENYVEKLSEGFSTLQDDDLTVLCGDISWGMTMEEALPDFEFIEKLPGRKLIIKGNHDYWWTTPTKAKTFFREHGMNTIDVLHNSSVEYNGVSICGTRGWFYEDEKGGEHDKKIMNREVMRLEASLKAASTDLIYVFLHYPPKYLTYECAQILELLEKYSVRRCYYGHIHGAGCRYAFNGTVGTTEMALVSADNVNFRPVKVI